MEINNAPAAEQAKEMDKGYDVSRRRFFQLAGGIAGAGLLLSACHKRTPTGDVYIGSGDTALLNYLYIIQQIEAAFYTQAFATPYYGQTTSDYELLKDLRDQEIAHREFFKTQLGADAVKDIKTDFSAVTFADRTSVLTHAAIIEDMAVAGMNGAVRFFARKDYVITISKMASVEARHGAYWHDLLANNTFSGDAIDADGLDKAINPPTIFAALKAYTQTHLDSTKLPG